MSVSVRKSLKFGSYQLSTSIIHSANPNIAILSTSKTTKPLPTSTSSSSSSSSSIVPTTITTDDATSQFTEKTDQLVHEIISKGDEIRILKTSKPATLAEDLKTLLTQLSELKSSYKTLTGEEYGPKPVEKKEKKVNDPEKSDGLSKSEQKKMKKEKDKEAKKAATSEVENQLSKPNVSSNLPVIDETLLKLFGDAPIIQSGTLTEKVYKNIEDVDANQVNQCFWIRGRIATTRTVGKGIFVVLRQHISTIQSVMFQGSTVPKAMVKYAASIPLESIVDVYVLVTIPAIPVQSVSIKSVELQIKEIHAISRAQELPFSVEDASRNEEYAEANQLPTVNQDTALNYRWIDTRTPANQAIFRIQAGVCQLFREFLIEKHFIEIHSPKLIGGASEGGSNVFTLKYFDRPACLAQSPQLYKQMAAACGGFERVFEIGPVFRAENSNTNRHMCEFTGLDFEMAIVEHYYEVLEVMADLFAFIFDGIADRYDNELQIISQQYPFEPIKYLRPALRITFKEGIDMLQAAGINAPYDEDISTPHEKALGKLVKDKYETDFYIMDKYPLSVRPFYTMPDPNDPTVSNSYDLFIRGEEIVSGAQRVHDPNLLIERATAAGIPISSIQSYVDAFKHGALPHGGGGIGLERVVMLYLGLKNIRKASMFPRDPQRLSP